MAAATEGPADRGPSRDGFVTPAFRRGARSPNSAGMVLVAPTPERLPAHRDALARGWSPDNLRPEAAAEQLRRIEKDPAGFLARLEDRDARGGPVTLPDGSQVPRLPSVRRWIWRDGFAGSIGLRWRPGTEALPPHCLGHVGYAVVPWRRREGLATAALREILPQARAVGLRHVEVTTDPGFASLGVIARAGGVLVERFDAPEAVGGGAHLRWRIALG